MFRWAQTIAVKNPSHQAGAIGPATRLTGPAGGSITRAVLQIGSKLPRTPKTAAPVEFALVTTSTNAPKLRAEWNPDVSEARTVMQTQDGSNNLQQSLLTGSQGDGPHYHWVLRQLGCFSTAFLVACANASLVGIVSSAHMGLPPDRSLVGSPNIDGWPPAQVILEFRSWTIHRAHPRAPPISVIASCGILLGTAH